MNIRNDVPLKDFSTMRLGDNAKALVTVTSEDELLEALAWAEANKLPTLMLGGGSNVIFKQSYNGLVIVNHIPGITITAEDDQTATLQIGAGENWDKVVAFSVGKNLHGIEFLSAIPGSAGATPVQNVGAYGAQISDVLVEVRAYNVVLKKFVTLSNSDCGFSYRMSIFKSPTDRQYIITAITLKLLKSSPTPPFYDSLQHYLDEHGITDYTPQTIRDAVVAIRAVKLPDPSTMANTGSFFKNPIIPAAAAHNLLERFPNMPHWPMPGDQVKLAAGWLIEQAGLKGYRAHGMKTYELHALVLVNESAKTYSDLAAYQKEITDKVFSMFGVRLEQEPELL